ncbi:hypothetical protein [Geothrix sp. PMB-07]|uniref:hypothetical protein n=1 Tax=Geothrix sp. PMB-07 TaxID=3068640 RepID=UPI002740BC26|nr:hypothetical protein [Geothrix sp. PMB-07]WLT31705.1 hypothetical protein Q9293_18535 [Geothrix sp. PMB-07]
MRSAPWRFLTGLMALALLAACGGGGGSSVNGDARLTIQAQFEKRTLSAAGLSNTTSLKPIRYCWAEVRDANSNALLSSGYLGSDGTGATTVPKGLSVYVQVFAEYQVPSSDPNSFFLRGDVKNAPLPSGYVSLTAFNALPLWSVTSATFVADRDGTLGVTALASNRIAGAFNIADQAVTFAAAVRDMDGSASFRLPNLHTFWTTSTNPADQTRNFPELTRSSSTSYLQSSSGRALFSHGVLGQNDGTPNTGTDEWSDGVLRQTFARLLFADYSYKADGSSSLSLLRRDNDNVSLSRIVPSESTAAFVAGFCDFLAAASGSQSQIMDFYYDGSGRSTVDVFDLADTGALPTSQGEFTRANIASSLWGIWKQALGGTPSGLATLWAAVRSTQALYGGVGEYEQATLGCYPSYLLGVQSRTTPSAWGTVLNQLSQASIPNPDPVVTSYFNSNALWLTRAVPLNESGSLQTYPASSNIYYDRNQSQVYRFTHGGGNRTISMTPTSGQDFYLELLGPGGWVAGDTSSSRTGQTRTLSLTNLPAGVYAARVRVGATTATGLNTFTITVN